MGFKTRMTENECRVLPPYLSGDIFLMRDREMMLYSVTSCGSVSSFYQTKCDLLLLLYLTSLFLFFECVCFIRQYVITRRSNYE